MLDESPMPVLLPDLAPSAPVRVATLVPRKAESDRCHTSAKAYEVEVREEVAGLARRTVERMLQVGRGECR